MLVQNPELIKFLTFLVVPSKASQQFFIIAHYKFNYYSILE